MRFRQGIRALASPLRPVDDALAAQYLSPALLALFMRMRRSERQHSLRVLQTLYQRGQTDPALMQAALLHDVGKTRAPFFLWERVIVVLTKAAAPALARRLGFGELSGRKWPDLVNVRRPFLISYQHPRWSAEMVSAAGGDSRTVWLIAAHQDHDAQTAQDEFQRELTPLLAALQAADDAN